MQGMMRALVRFARDFAVGVHVGHGIRHGVPAAPRPRNGRAADAVVPNRDVEPVTPAGPRCRQRPAAAGGFPL